jgi:hypothetical protein
MSRTACSRADGWRAFVIVYLFAGIGVFLFGVVRIGEMIVRAGRNSKVEPWQPCSLFSHPNYTCPCINNELSIAEEKRSPAFARRAK